MNSPYSQNQKETSSRGIINRVTISMDDETDLILDDIKKVLDLSQSEIFRRALKVYAKYGYLFENNENFDQKLQTYFDMLHSGEHIILDYDHYLSLLKFVESSPEDKQNEFWNEHKEIGRSHAEEFTHKMNNFYDIIRRLEDCNFFKIKKESTTCYTLLLGTDVSKNFIRIFLEEILKGMGFKAEIKEGFAKLQIFLKNIIL